MTDIRPMPRVAVFAAGWMIALAAVAGLGIGVLRDLKGGSANGEDAGEIVAPIKAANAQPLTAPPVTEADVRRWAREEMLAQAARAPKKSSTDDDAVDPTPGSVADAPTASPGAPPIVPGQPITGAIPAGKPSTPQPAPQIPF